MWLVVLVIKTACSPIKDLNKQCRCALQSCCSHVACRQLVSCPAVLPGCCYVVCPNIECFVSGPGDKVCYYYGPRQAVYEELGHAEVVQMELRGEAAQTRRQMEAFADTYFGQFRKTPFGMMRLDPQDSGPAYRNVIGIPKGVDSPLFEVLKASLCVT